MGVSPEKKQTANRAPDQVPPLRERLIAACLTGRFSLQHPGKPEDVARMVLDQADAVLAAMADK